MPYETREEWLMALVAAMAPRFEEQGAPLPERLRVSVGWPSVGALEGRRGRRVGECWHSACSADGAVEIFISPVLHEAMDVAEVVSHELVHAALDGQNAGHGPKFRKLAKALGHEGKMRSTTAGPKLIEAVQPILDEIGEYPHAKLDSVALAKMLKKQSTRMVKCKCGECGFIARTTRKWLESVGAPLCACNGEAMETAE